MPLLESFPSLSVLCTRQYCIRKKNTHKNKLIICTNSRFSRVLLTRSAALSIFAPLSPIRLPWRLYQREIGYKRESSGNNWCTYNVNGVQSIKNGPEQFIGINLTTGRQSPSLFDKWHGIFYMPSRIDEAGHTKAFDYLVAEHWGESQRAKRSLVGFEPTTI